MQRSISLSLRENSVVRSVIHCEVVKGGKSIPLQNRYCGSDDDLAIVYSHVYVIDM